ncbi:MAG: radical SAM protein, partial [Anaerolineae bacterium]|nr:radical SAM protein [Anaerolineae bacterium]
LARHAQELRDAGLKRVNISLDTLRPERFAAITRQGKLSDVLDGIAAAHTAGLEPVKINTVVIRGMNDDEIVDLARRTVGDGWHVRFIEWMPVGAAAGAAVPEESHTATGADWNTDVVTAAEMRAAIESALGPLEPAHSDGAGPARYFQLPGAAGTVGFITPLSEHFCNRCNRLRLTADGQIRPCLLSDLESDLRTPLRQGAGVAEIKALLKDIIARKPERHHLEQAHESAHESAHKHARKRAMSEIGG